MIPASILAFFGRLVARHAGGRRFDLKIQAQAYRFIPQAVLADLAEFCGASEPSPQNGDPFLQGRRAGRRDVWLRIIGHRAIREDEIIALLRGEGIAATREK